MTLDSTQSLQVQGRRLPYDKSAFSGCNQSLFSVAGAFAQSQLGAISGAVQDPTGVMIGGATVTITNPATGMVRTLLTNGVGQFNAPALPAGEYQLKAELHGFVTVEQTVLVLNVGSTLTLRLAMKPGGVGETINVAAGATIDSGKTEEATVVNRNQINDLPINGRRADQFALLAQRFHPAVDNQIRADHVG